MKRVEIKKAEVIEKVVAEQNEKTVFANFLVEKGYEVEDMGYPSVLCSKEDMGKVYDEIVTLAKMKEYRGTYGVKAKRALA